MSGCWRQRDVCSADCLSAEWQSAEPGKASGVAAGNLGRFGCERNRLTNSRLHNVFRFLAVFSGILSLKRRMPVAGGGGIHVRIGFWQAMAPRFGSLRYDVGMPSCQQKNCCALTALDGNGGSKPRALPWAVMWRPFRPWIRTALLEKGGHGFTIDGTAQGLRYSRLGSLRDDDWPG
jgi:hypothetical protein